MKEDILHLQDILTAIEKIQTILIHDYDRVGYQEVWAVVQRDLPDLKQTISRILESHQPQDH